ncbi:MAG TPA: hypothetical protein VGH91_10520 [Gammaproteobacteria bacterium]|jgi:hypothetical protein
MAEGSGRDLLRGTGLLLWGVPVAVLALSAHMGGLYPTIAWPLALVFMGAVCLVNARRCGRLHCFLTGPFFLLMAVLSLLYGLGIMDLGRRGWSDLSLALLVGAALLICVPEQLFGKYVRRKVS